MAMTRELLRTKDQRDCQKLFMRAAVGDVNSQVRHKSHSVLCSISVCAPERIRGPRQLAARPCRLGAAQGCAVMRLSKTSLHATREDLQRTIAERRTLDPDHKSSNEESCRRMGSCNARMTS